MNVRLETCSYCKGRKVAERAEERVGGVWRALPARCLDGMPQYAIDEMFANHAKEYGERAFLRFAECACPRCDGRGEYEVEYFTCKVF